MEIAEINKAVAIAQEKIAHYLSEIKAQKQKLKKLEKARLELAAQTIRRSSVFWKCTWFARESHTGAGIQVVCHIQSGNDALLKEWTKAMGKPVDFMGSICLYHKGSDKITLRSDSLGDCQLIFSNVASFEEYHFGFKLNATIDKNLQKLL